MFEPKSTLLVDFLISPKMKQSKLSVASISKDVLEVVN
jgi:hypothetical protein